MLLRVEGHFDNRSGMGMAWHGMSTKYDIINNKVRVRA